MGFITSGSWVRGNFGGPLRKYLAENAKVDSMIDFGEFQPFEGAEMIRPTIAVLTKQPPGGTMRLFKWLTAGSPPENLSDVITNAFRMRTDHLGEEGWELEADDVIALRKRMTACGSTLAKYTGGKFLRGVVTGANDVFVINTRLRDELIAKDPASAQIIKPLIQGSQIRPWHIEQTDEHLIFTWRGIEIERYPAILEYLCQYRERLEPKPEGWTGSRGQKWAGRKPGIYKWYEIQDAVDYWQEFEQEKILWPDIAKLPRFTLDRQQHYLTNTGYVIPIADYYLLGILSSWATWFIISKTAQPLRLRGDRWQYRLFGQFMESLPIPSASDEDRQALAALAQRCNVLGQDCYDLQENFRRRVRATFGQQPDGTSLGDLNQKAEAWWELTLQQLGAALKTSFKLSSDPLKNPRTADEWESYLAEKQAIVHRLTGELADAEAELNDRVYRLFNLTPDEIKLLKREVEHKCHWRAQWMLTFTATTGSEGHRKCPRLARGIVTFLANESRDGMRVVPVVATSVRIPRASRGH